MIGDRVVRYVLLRLVMKRDDCARVGDHCHRWQPRDCCGGVLAATVPGRRAPMVGHDMLGRAAGDHCSDEAILMRLVDRRDHPTVKRYFRHRDQSRWRSPLPLRHDFGRCQCSVACSFVDDHAIFSKMPSVRFAGRPSSTRGTPSMFFRLRGGTAGSSAHTLPESP